MSPYSRIKELFMHIIIKTEYLPSLTTLSYDSIVFEFGRLHTKGLI